MKKIYVLIAAIIISFGLSAQDISLSIEKKSIDELQKGDKVLIGVFVQNQSKPIAGFQLYVEYDSIVLTYSNVLNKYSAFSNEWISNDNGYFFAANWLTLDPKGLNFKGREKLFDLEFTYHGGETDLFWQTEQIISEGTLTQGETMFVAVGNTIMQIELINGCLCGPK